MTNEYNLMTAKEHLEASMKIAQEEYKKFSHQYEDDV